MNRREVAQQRQASPIVDANVSPDGKASEDQEALLFWEGHRNASSWDPPQALGDGTFGIPSDMPSLFYFVASFADFRIQGHADVSRDLLKAQKWDAPAIKIVARASADPDVMYWSVPEAHAQTADPDNDSRPGRADAQRCFFVWVASRIHAAQKACGADMRLAATQVGFALHAIQDLAAHDGMSNAEHSHLSSSRCNPDKSTEAISRAKVFSQRFFADVLKAAIEPMCFTSISEAYEPPLTFDEEAKALDRPRDLSLKALKAYRASAKHYASSDHVRWPISSDRDVKDIMTTILRTARGPMPDAQRCSDVVRLSVAKDWR